MRIKNDTILEAINAEEVKINEWIAHNRLKPTFMHGLSIMLTNSMSRMREKVKAASNL